MTGKRMLSIGLCGLFFVASTMTLPSAGSAEKKITKIIYIVPGTGMGDQEMGRRRSILQAHAGAGVEVGIVESKVGPLSIESAYDEYLSVPESILRAVEAEKAGYDGIILGCFADPGIDPIREMVKIPVIGPGETSMLIASMLGHKFSIISLFDNEIATWEVFARKVGIDKKLASVRAVNIPVLDLATDFEKTKNRMIEEARKAKEIDKAEVIVLGCMSMAFMMVSDEMQQKLGIPVVNPAIVSLKVLEGLIEGNLSHSKAAYPVPRKL